MTAREHNNLSVPCSNADQGEYVKAINTFNKLRAGSKWAMERPQTNRALAQKWILGQLGRRNRWGYLVT